MICLETIQVLRKSGKGTLYYAGICSQGDKNGSQKLTSAQL